MVDEMVAVDATLPSLAVSIFCHFEGIDADIELPDRSADTQQPVDPWAVGAAD